MKLEIVFIFGLIIGAAITAIVNILFTPLKSWFNSVEKFECDFRTANVFKVETHPIVVKKKFGQTKLINCFWFRRKESEMREYDGKKYLYCPFGENYDPSIKEGGKCPFF